MNYELLEQLRDGGFPQKEGSLDRVATGAPGDLPPYRWAYYPTLEELIEACEKHLDDFPKNRINTKTNIRLHGERGVWLAKLYGSAKPFIKAPTLPRQ
jgi:hypothetical protein